ncbi:hypothetical protein [Maricaulis sp.]|uniref:hypothetical protein n=1 Tax=Maricaulis sp. TaxID=1486257 RepID=UPI0026231F58|nr:hypothetical protein [Maricaulis sp.]
MKMLLMMSAAALFGASAAAAQDNQTFVTLDSNADGSVSFDEALLADPELSHDAFAEHDTDGNGSLNVAEFEAWLQARAEADAEMQDGGPVDASRPDTPEADAGLQTGIDTQVEADTETSLEEPAGISGAIDAEADTVTEDPMRG